MEHFHYRAARLHIEDVPVARIAESLGTPFYVYSQRALQDNLQALAAAFADPPLICYSVKANDNLAVIAALARAGAGADVVSEGELRRALAAGVARSKIIFSGAGKSPRELTFALESRICQINAESEDELDRIARTAEAMGRTAPVALRVNPDVDAQSHEKISTGRAGDKFGIALSAAPQVYARAARRKSLRLTGLAVHIGSQIESLAPFRAAFARLAGLARQLREQNLPVERLDLGGGLGIGRSRPGQSAPGLPVALADYARLITELFAPLGCRIILEPGRVIAGPAGLLAASVLYEKQVPERRFLILDAAMNDLIRPALYDAPHPVIPVAQPKPGAPIQPYDVVGPVCESGDLLARACPLPPMTPGALLAILDAGAYGAVLASSYNSRPKIPEVLVQGGQMALIRPRQTYAEMLARDVIPAWLAPAPPEQPEP